VVAVPTLDAGAAYIASGTWSLVGIEIDGPVTTEDARLANFTNEGGVDGTTRFLRNVGGLWLLQESMRTWSEQGLHLSLDRLLRDATAFGPGPVIDVDDPAFIPPNDMPGRIADAVAATGQARPTEPAAIVRCVLESLAAGYSTVLQRAATISGREISSVHIVGGGSQNELLCQLTADASRLPVVAGPIEATALGNVLIQARARGALTGDLRALRERARVSSHLRSYTPTS
jgi:rhamnulokinase